MQYSIEFCPAVLKVLRRFPKKDLIRIKKKIDELCNNLPNPQTTKMKGDNPFHKIRSGNYRIVYEIQDEKLIILVIKIGHRKDAYKNFPKS